MVAQRGSLPLGFLGLGAMGGPMVTNLLAAGRRVVAYDPCAERLSAAVAVGAEPAADEREVVRAAAVVMTSLPSSEVWATVATERLLPAAQPEQLFVDLGTTAPPVTRRLAEAFAARGAHLVDAPVSGGPGGAAAGTLHIFVGGEAGAVERCRPLLEILGRPEHITWCGPSGAGQVVKGVNQLVMGLTAAAQLEALALGVAGGVDPTTIAAAMDGDEDWRRAFAKLARRVADGQGEAVETKFSELHYYLEEAAAQGAALPLTTALHGFCERGERVARDALGRPAPSFWRELRRAAAGGERDVQ